MYGDVQSTCIALKRTYAWFCLPQKREKLSWQFLTLFLWIFVFHQWLDFYSVLSMFSIIHEVELLKYYHYCVCALYMCECVGDIMPVEVRRQFCGISPPLLSHLQGFQEIPKFACSAHIRKMFCIVLALQFW